MGIWYRAPSKRNDWVQRRKDGRRSVRYTALMRSAEDGSALGPCMIADVSEGGARLVVLSPAGVPDTFLLALSRNARTFRRCTVRWRSKSEIGVQFDA